MGIKKFGFQIGCDLFFSNWNLPMPEKVLLENDLGTIGSEYSLLIIIIMFSDTTFGLLDLSNNISTSIVVEVSARFSTIYQIHRLTGVELSKNTLSSRLLKTTCNSGKI